MYSLHPCFFSHLCTGLGCIDFGVVLPWSLVFMAEYVLLLCWCLACDGSVYPNHGSASLVLTGRDGGRGVAREVMG